MRCKKSNSLPSKTKIKPLERGLFITLEGGEGAGKSTLISHLSRSLSFTSLETVITREPGGTCLGQKMRALLLDESFSSLSSLAELFLFLADRAEHVEKVILPALLERKIVLCDRFTDSTLCYQGTDQEEKKEEIARSCQLASGGLRPDLTLLLDLDPKIGLTRVKKKRGNSYDRIEERGIAFHSRVRRAFLDCALQEPDRFVVIDAEKPLFEVQKLALQAVREIIEKRNG